MTFQKKGERRKDGGSGSNQHGSKSATVTHLHKTTPELAAEAGMSERTYKRREKLLKKKGQRATRSSNGSNQHGSKGASVTPFITPRPWPRASPKSASSTRLP